MKFKYKITKEVESFISNSKLTEIVIGCSDSQVIKIEKKIKHFIWKFQQQEAYLKNWEKQKLGNQDGNIYLKIKIKIFVLMNKYFLSLKSKYVDFSSEIDYNTKQ